MADVTSSYLSGGNYAVPDVSFPEQSECLVGTLKRTCEKGLFVIPDASILSPYVIARIEGKNGWILTVGNHPSPSHNNHAAIKSFEYNASQGANCKIEIIDEKGGAFDKFFKASLAKCLSDFNSMYKVQVQFGWLGAKCSGGNDAWPMPSLSTSTSPDWYMNFLLVNMDVQYGEGKIKYVLTCVDLMQTQSAARYTNNFSRRTLKKAIIDMLESEQPKIDVAFLRRTDKGRPEEWKFNARYNNKQNPPGKIAPAGSGTNQSGSGNASTGEGPFLDYPMHNQDKLSCLRDWLKDIVTDAPPEGGKGKGGLGIVPVWDAFRDKPTIILWEDFMPHCKKEILCNRNLGTFIVNGGKCSNVLSFHPTINWIPTMSAFGIGGTPGGSNTQKPTATDNDTPCKLASEHSGSSETIMSGQAVTQTGGKEAPEMTKDANKKQTLAAAIHEVIRPIEADLRVVGIATREFSDVSTFLCRSVSIVVINPYSLENKDNLLVWSAEDATTEKSTVNNILTNQNWFIKGVSHQIRDGKFTTSIKLFLPTPGIDVLPDGTLGGDTQTTYTLPACK